MDFKLLINRQQRVVIGGDHSDWAAVRSGVPQGTVLGPLFFCCSSMIYLKIFHPMFVCSLMIVLFTEKLSTTSDSQALQHDLDTLLKWESDGQMCFNTEKCFVLKITHAC